MKKYKFLIIILCFMLLLCSCNKKNKIPVDIDFNQTDEPTKPKPNNTNENETIFKETNLTKILESNKTFIDETPEVPYIDIPSNDKTDNTPAKQGAPIIVKPNIVDEIPADPSKNFKEIKILKDSNGNPQILYGGKVIYSIDNPYTKITDEVYRFDHLFVFVTNCMGVKNVHVFDPNYETIFHYLNVYDKKNGKYNLNIEGFSVDNKGITFTASSINPDKSIAGVSDNIKIETCNDYKKYKDEIIGGTFRLDYIGNDVFSELKEISLTKVSDNKDYSSKCK